MELNDTISLKYYAFDWDDNILMMPTTIILKSDNGNEVKMSTKDFATYRKDIGNKNFTYKNQTIVGFADNPFRNFREEGDKQFIIDSMLAQPGPSWSDFVEAINNASIFSIITARGHNPNALKESVYNFIVSNHNGIDRNQVIKNIIKFKKISNIENKSDIDLIKYYLDLCKFYPVTYGQGSAANPEELKIVALQDFISYIKKVANFLNEKVNLKNNISNNFIPYEIGFSDDDEGNLKSIKDKLGHKKKLKIFSTKQGEKKQF